MGNYVVDSKIHKIRPGKTSLKGEALEKALFMVIVRRAGRNTRNLGERSVLGRETRTLNGYDLTGHKWLKLSKDSVERGAAGKEGTRRNTTAQRVARGAPA